MLSKSAFVKEFFEQWRNNLSLKTIIMNFPRTGTSKKTDTSHLAAQCQMHWKSVTANQTPMIRDIPQVLKNRRSFGQDVHDQAVSFQCARKVGIVCPVFHGPDRSR